jgi:hypothetical protein
VPTPGNDAERAIDKLHGVSPEQATEKIADQIREDVDRRILNELLNRIIP